MAITATFGAMSDTDPDGSMHSLYKGGFYPDTGFIPAPQKSIRWLTGNLPSWSPCVSFLQQRARQIAAVILEPIVQGAGGMRFYHQYLRQVRAPYVTTTGTVDYRRSATGFGRTGKPFACEWQAGINPDICLGKA